ncbi:hypothetical protein [Mycobacterium sp. 050134]
MRGVVLSGGSAGGWLAVVFSKSAAALPQVFHAATHHIATD